MEDARTVGCNQDSPSRWPSGAGYAPFSDDPYADTGRYMSKKTIIAVLPPILDGVTIYMFMMF
jgi:hypothetical protein